MNKYEDGGASLKEDRTHRLEADKNFFKFKNIVLSTKDYALGSARELLETLSLAEARKIFERFNSEEGALPDRLAIEYIKLIYSPTSLLEKMDEDRSFYEALAEIGKEVKEAGINLNQELVQEQIKKISKELLKEPEEI